MEAGSTTSALLVSTGGLTAAYPAPASRPTTATAPIAAQRRRALSTNLPIRASAPIPGALRVSVSNQQLTDRCVGQMTDRHVVIGQADTGQSGQHANEERA